ncbi:uncharacterized protein ASCRUDRAFT_81640 [Ascoidea rubescens DSM 1968]|uniref:Uncharacterized protein n=1 Tax=Ascoidea rubescens DSM 1968 TaxID=1344418 RepID=A0A1D2VFB7_9ASCO|nr:hypothetical protein ASCRUDRAFT_81640 [Ascoidea rubescens DSM 1968]ODV60210.1 hypothetical protein ASCRUDRAFT_81640 [Ascoidea rubescens DSM 1968]
MIPGRNFGVYECFFNNIYHDKQKAYLLNNNNNNNNDTQFKTKQNRNSYIAHQIISNLLKQAIANLINCKCKNIIMIDLYETMFLQLTPEYAIMEMNKIPDFSKYKAIPFNYNQVNFMDLQDNLQNKNVDDWIVTTKQNSYHFANFQYNQNLKLNLTRFNSIYFQNAKPIQFSIEKLYWRRIFQTDPMFNAQFGLNSDIKMLIKIFDPSYLESIISHSNNFYSKVIHQFVIEISVFNAMRKYQSQYLFTLFCHGFLDGSYATADGNFSLVGLFLLMEYFQDDKHLMKDKWRKKVLVDFGFSRYMKSKKMIAKILGTKHDLKESIIMKLKDINDLRKAFNFKKSSVSNDNIITQKKVLTYQIWGQYDFWLCSF